tara:strand:- start:514 stop:2088 length:1575 start_codon:yes stop_codon:yes gene_type:complete
LKVLLLSLKIKHLMKNNYYITTPIYYPSAKPHMGHAYSSIVADFFARFKRINGYKVFFLTGTDEHGQKIKKASIDAKMDTMQFCNKISQTFKDLTETLNLSNDDFIRTTEPRHKITVEKVWNILEKKDEIYLSKYSGWYSISDEAFYTESEVETIKDVKVSKISGSKVEWVEEESYFFKLSQWQNKLLDYYKENPDFIRPESRKNEVISFVTGGLKDLSVSRKSLKWGIKVPTNNNHVIYVWLDALVNYLSALNFEDENNLSYKKFWPASLHLIGKDILRFHAVYWPAFLLAANLPLPKHIYGHGWILSNDEKMSKSKGNILDPIEIIEDYGLDPLRFYLLKEVSFGNDGSISKEKLESCINSDLANNFGNFCQRVVSFTEKNLSLNIPDAPKFLYEDNIILDSFDKNFDDVIKSIDQQNINFYMNFLMDSMFSANKYFNDQAPWAKKNDKERMSTIIFASLELIRKISIIIYPIMPESSLKVLDIFDIKEADIDFNSIKDNNYLLKKKKIKKISILFKKISND